MADNLIQIEVEFEDGRKGFAYLKDQSAKVGAQAGDEFAENFSDRVKSSFKALGAALIAIGVGGFLRKSIDEAIEQESANRRLEESLRRVGANTAANLGFLTQQADLLAQTTKLTDDQAASLLALSNNYARSSEQAAQLVRAASDLAAVTGIDVSQAVEVLGNSLNGIGRGLNTIIPGFKETKTEALAAGAALKFIQDNFAGSAEAQYQGIGASISKVSKSFNELAESFGNFLLKTIDVERLAKTISGALDTASLFFNNLSISVENLIIRLGRMAIAFGLAYTAMNPKQVGGAISDFLADIAIQFIKTAQETGKLGPAFKAAFLSGEIAAKGFALAMSVLKATITLGLTIAIDALVTKFLELKQQGVGTIDALKVVFLNIGEVILTVVGSILTGIQALASSLPVVGESLASGLDTGITKIADAKFALESMGNSIVNQAVVTRDLAAATDEANSALEKYKITAQDAPRPLSAMEEASKKVAETFKSALVSNISNGIQTIVKSMATGKFSFDQFGKLLLGIIGNIAIQIGTTLLSIGIAVDALKTSLLTFTGGPAIAAGIALIAIGALLSSMAAGGGDTPNVQAGGGVADGGGVAAVSSTNPATEERQAPGTQVLVNVEGNIFNGREQAQLIAENLQEYFDTNNGLLVRA